MNADLMLVNLLCVGVVLCTAAAFWVARWRRSAHVWRICAAAFLFSACAAGLYWYEVVLMQTCSSATVLVDADGVPVETEYHGC